MSPIFSDFCDLKIRKYELLKVGLFTEKIQYDYFLKYIEARTLFKFCFEKFCNYIFDKDLKMMD